MPGPATVFADVGEMCAEVDLLPDALSGLAGRLGAATVLDATARVVREADVPPDPFARADLLAAVELLDADLHALAGRLRDPRRRRRWERQWARLHRRYQR